MRRPLFVAALTDHVNHHLFLSPHHTPGHPARDTGLDTLPHVSAPLLKAMFPSLIWAPPSATAAAISLLKRAGAMDNTKDPAGCPNLATVIDGLVKSVSASVS
jgi:hypothetical protein